MTDLRKAAEAVLERWDSPAWEWKKQGPTADLMANLRKALAAERPKPEPVAAQHRFRFPRYSTLWARKIGSPDWGPWHACKVSNRPAWEIDSQGWEVEYRPLYTAPPEDEALRRDAERLRAASEKLFRKWSNAAPYHQWEPEMFEMELALYPPKQENKK